MSTLFKKLTVIFERLSSKPRIGGLHIGDGALYFARVDGDPISLRLPPGIVEEGKIVDRDRFRELLGQLRDMIDSEEHTRAVPVIVVLPAAGVYTQSFNVPNLGPDRLTESAELNLQMLSPIPRDAAYMSWQRIAETPDHIELLAAFAEKRSVDDLKDILVQARFHPIAFEFPGLALTRFVSQFIRLTDGSTLVFYLSSDGMNLFLYRGEALCFDYFRSWHSIQGSSREISRELFDAVVSQEVQKVVNFTINRFKEAPSQVVIIAPGFDTELRTLVRDRFGFEATTLDRPTPELEAPWYVALGAALRGNIDRARDESINLAPVSSAELFYEEQLLDFIRLWRGITGGVLALFLILFVGGAYLLSSQSKSLGRQLDLFTSDGQSTKLATLEGEARRFNDLVGTISGVSVGGKSYATLMGLLEDIAKTNHVEPDSFAIASLGNPIEVSAEAPDYDTVLRFTEAMKATPGMSEVTLPLSRISTREDNSVAFVVSFRFTPPTP